MADRPCPCCQSPTANTGWDAQDGIRRGASRNCTNIDCRYSYSWSLDRTRTPKFIGITTAEPTFGTDEAESKVLVPGSGEVN